MLETKHVPLIAPDLPDFDEVAPQFKEILENGRITNFGKYVNELERMAGEYVGGYAVTVSSGTMGLLFTLQALGIKQGSKVILPSHTFMATAQAVVYAGGTPIFAECDEDMLIDTDDLAQLLRKHPDTELVIPVHMYGLPCDTEKIERVVRENSKGAKVVYDAAHAFGASRDGKHVGAAGNAEVFSLSVTKILVTVEGGMVTTKDASLAERIRHMRNYGIEANYDAWYPGLNGKMSEFHAIVGIANLEKIDERMARRQEVAREYERLIQEAVGYQVVRGSGNIQHTFKDFTIRLPESIAPRRPEMVSRLKEMGIETRAYFFPPVHEQKRFKPFADRPLPRTEKYAREVLTLPFYTRLTTDEMEYVAESLKRVHEELA